jgi:glycosyltransferase involved in cell wall biosynthesis
VWEAAGIPHFWRELLPLVDEIWVPSSYVANSVAGHVACPVVTLPHVVDPPAATFGRSAIGVPTGKFLFLFAFDALSNLDRKNPAGVLHAYCNAFEPHGDVQLILKCKNLTDAELEALHERRNGRSDIRIINQPMSRGDASSLIAACDCYVSLHRAEGFGLTMAEAMFYGKPVIATGYSGNVDFMAGGFGFLVNYGMTVTERDCGYYRAGTEWAEPDLDHASRLMRYVVDHPEVTGRIGRAAAEKMRNEYSAKAIGGRINDRLSLLMNSGAFGRYR